MASTKEETLVEKKKSCKKTSQFVHTRKEIYKGFDLMKQKVSRWAFSNNSRNPLLVETFTLEKAKERYLLKNYNKIL
jgi:hypothetical protein